MDRDSHQKASLVQLGIFYLSIVSSTRNILLTEILEPRQDILSVFLSSFILTVLPSFFLFFLPSLLSSRDKQSKTFNGRKVN